MRWRDKTAPCMDELWGEMSGHTKQHSEAHPSEYEVIYVHQIYANHSYIFNLPAKICPKSAILLDKVVKEYPLLAGRYQRTFAAAR